jgi:CubicO group peptidase (beta-lactamase class C family)
MAILVDRGLVKYSDPVATHWHEFGKNGKQAVTIADVMRHEAGLSYFSKAGDPKTPVAVTTAMLKDVDALENTIANSSLNCSPGERYYHAMTRGWIVSAVVRRVDPKKRTFGKFMQDEICVPLGITYFCGIPEREQANYKIADGIHQSPNYTQYCEELPAKLGLLPTPAPLPEGSHIFVKVADFFDFTATFTNTAEGRAAEIPSSNMFTNARSMAKVNACMAKGGKLGNVQIMSEKACAESMAFWKTEMDRSLGWLTCFSQGGFFREARLEAPWAAAGGDSKRVRALAKLGLGWGGFGGSASYWHPEKHVAFSYVMNGMLTRENGDYRTTPLVAALADIISP